MTISRRIAKGAGAATLSLAFLVAGTIASTPSTYAATPMSAGGKALVTNTGGDNIRVRAGAGTDSKQIAEAHEGEIVTLLSGPSKDDSGNIWYKVQAPGGAGWIISDFLQDKGGAPAQQTGAASPTKTNSASSASKLTGTAHVANTDGDPLRVRSAASSKGDVLTLLPPTASASVKAGPVVDSDNIAWYQISANGVTGWAMAQYLAQAQTAPVAAPASAAPAVAPAQPKAQPQKAATGPKLVGFAHVANTDGDPLRVRSAASTSGSILTKLGANASVVIKSGPALDSSNVAWYQISANGVTGWAMAQYLAQTPVTPDAQAQPAVQVKAAAPAPVAQPATQAAAPAAPASAPKAAPASAAQPADPARSGTARGASQPATVQSSSRGSTIVGIAMNYVGYRYIFGGTTPSGFDCSGFVYYVLNRAGKRVGRNMFDQLASGPRVGSKNLQPGDLVFFSNTYKAGLSHAGIYIGNGKFVHAENESTGVVVSQLWSSYWASHYTTAVRP